MIESLFANQAVILMIEYCVLQTKQLITLMIESLFANQASNNFDDWIYFLQTKQVITLLIENFLQTKLVTLMIKYILQTKQYIWWLNTLCKPSR